MQSAYRLKRNASFNYVYKKGNSIGSPLMVLNFVPASSCKVGVSISKKIGKSVQRNLIKRRIYEQFATFMPRIKGSYNYVVVARERIRDASFEEIGSCIDFLLHKLGHVD